ncbi:hypothetical protein [Methylobacter sp.]|uniref:hypothetical protein n=1 Tax=Methylobacter sp. TaxID=2051955 RepID=UPI00248880CB|nr:hypothetical protein [Methylobacter sp.]MDI1278632.1 hypothetical protein [Methylobacter sp.]MDI1359452.1 hypothetical protein [Methylobacter sp.]
MAEAPILPDRGSLDVKDAPERIYRTALAQKDYIDLELEAMDRGLRPFGLTKSVMTLYLRKQLVLVKELPQDLQAQIITHFRAKQTSRQS